jgi:hypothetical protein
MPALSANERSGLDAGRPFLLHWLRCWPGATHRECKMQNLKRLVLFQVILICRAAIGVGSPGTDTPPAHLMRGISLKKATIESNSPAVFRLGAVELPATDVHLLADITIQTSCNYFSGTFTNKTVRFSVRIAEDPERKAYHELARQMCEYWKDRELLANTEKGFLPQDREVFQSGTNYVLLVAPSSTPHAGFLLWFGGRIIQGADPFATHFYGQVADFTIDGVPVMHGQKSLPPRKILLLFKRGTFGASNARSGLRAQTALCCDIGGHWPSTSESER